MSPNSSQIQISASSRGIADHFFCSVCDEYVWDCDHLIEERLEAPRSHTSRKWTSSFVYDG